MLSGNPNRLLYANYVSDCGAMHLCIDHPNDGSALLERVRHDGRSQRLSPDGAAEIPTVHGYLPAHGRKRIYSQALRQEVETK